MSGWLSSVRDWKPFSPRKGKGEGVVIPAECIRDREGGEQSDLSYNNLEAYRIGHTRRLDSWPVPDAGLSLSFPSHISLPSSFSDSLSTSSPDRHPRQRQRTHIPTKMSHRGSMGPPPDKEMGLGGPPMHYAPTPLANGGSMKVGGAISYDTLAEKYSRLKRRYFDMEQVGCPFLSISTKDGRILTVETRHGCSETKGDDYELQRSGERNSKLRQERK